MGQMGFHDLDKRLDAVSAKGDPLGPFFEVPTRD